MGITVGFPPPAKALADLSKVDRDRLVETIELMPACLQLPVPFLVLS